jgi:signal peptidase I
MQKTKGFIETLILVVVFIILWKSGILDTSFELLLLIATFTCLIGFLSEHFYFKKKRMVKAKEYEEKELKDNENLKNNGIDRKELIEEEKKEILKRPVFLDWTADLFPLIFVIFIIRSFFFEPFTIPSGSMMPTLIAGDNIIVNKFSYGFRLPVIDTKLTSGNDVKRGDIIVFHYPLDPKINYIKRAIGLPGDVIEYKNKDLFLNGKKVDRVSMENYTYPKEHIINAQYKENLDGVEHRILIDNNISGTISKVMSESAAKNCEYDVEYVKCVVPQGEYFMMGDNRDGSLDSRYWGFVPDKNLVGKAIFIWSNFGNMSRVGNIS